MLKIKDLNSGSTRQFTSMDKLIDAIASLDALEKSKKYKARLEATASDPEDMRAKIEALRAHFKSQAVQIGYESKQKLASLLREVQITLTDVIHSMNVVGEDSKAMRKLQDRIGDVTRSMSFLGEGDEDGDGFHDHVDYEDDGEDDDLDLGDDKKAGNAQKAFKNAVKSLRVETDDVSDDKNAGKDEEKEAAVKDDKKDVKQTTKDVGEEAAKDLGKGAVKKASPDNEDGDSEEGEDVLDEASIKPKKKIVPVIKKKKAKIVDESEEDEGGFVKGLMDKDKEDENEDEAESSADNAPVVAVAGMRFVYLGIKNVKKDGKNFDVVRAGFGSHSSDMLTVYYYKPTKKFLDGDAARVDKVFRKVLEKASGYAKLASEINAKARSGHLEIISKKEQLASSVLGVSEGAWSWRGVGTHPKNEDKTALWFEIGDKEFAAIPSKKFESGDVDEANSYVHANIIGKKDGGPGVSYQDGLNKIEALVDSGKLKVIFHAKL